MSRTPLIHPRQHNAKLRITALSENKYFLEWKSRQWIKYDTGGYEQNEDNTSENTQIIHN